MPKIALSTGSLYNYGTARVFELAAAAGFDAVEVLIDDRWDTRNGAYLRRLSEATGLPVAAVHNPFVPYVSGWPRDTLGRLSKSASVAQEVGAGVVVTHLPLHIRGVRLEFWGFPIDRCMVPIPLPNEGNYRRFLLRGLAGFESSTGLKVGVENMPARRFLGHRFDIHALNSLESLAGLPHLTFDTTHLATWGLDLLAAYERLRWRIVHVHLSNFDGKEHRRPDDGHLPLGTFLQRLGRDGYQGAVSLELHPEALEAEDEAHAAAHLRRAVEFCREHTAR